MLFFSQTILLFLVFPTAIFASSSKTQVPPLTDKEIARLQSLRFNPSDSSKIVLEKLKENFLRDCHGHAYDQDHGNLMLGPTLETFPIDKVISYLKETEDICPYAAMNALAIVENSKGKKEAQDLSIDYLSRFKSFKTFAWSSYMWDIRPILNRLFSGCSAESEKAFFHIYCSYSSDEEIDYLFQEWKKHCPQTTTSKCNSRSSK